MARLVKVVDEKVEQNQEKRLASFVVLLSDDPEKAEKDIKQFAEKHGIKTVAMTVFEGAAGPEDYKIAKDANITIHLWIGQKVQAKHVLATDKVDQKSIDPILEDLGKMLN